MAQKTISVLLNAVTGPYTAAMSRASATTAGFGATAKGASAQVGGMAKSTGMLTKGLIGGGALVAGVKAVADAAIGWESAFADVRKTVDGTPEQLGAIAGGLRDMSKEIPTSAQDLAGIAASAGQLGIETDNVLGFTRVIADLGETTNLAGQQGATELARFANITGMAQTDFDRLGSTIVELGNNFATTEAEISEMAMRIAGAGTQVGMSEAEILSFATALSSVGIRAQAGGSAISKVMIDIANEVETSGDKLETFAEVAGMSASQFSDVWREDAAGALVAFIEGLGGMEESGGSALQVLEELEITEVRMRDALLRASGAGDLLNDTLETGNRAWEENNALQEEAALRYDTTEAKMEIAKNAVKDLATELGASLLPAIGEASEALSNLLSLELPGGTGADVTDLLGHGSDFTLLGLLGALSQGEQAGPIDNVQRFLATGGHGSMPVLGPLLGGAEDAASGKSGSGGVPSGSNEQFFRAEAALQSSLDTLEQIPGAARPAQRSIEDMVGPYSDLAGSAEDALQAQQDHADWLKRATDPVFNLHGALTDLQGAQQDYNDAVEEFGKNSPEAAAAAFEVVKRVRDLQLAVMDGDLSFAEFEAQLKDWERQGLISAQVADLARREVSKLTDASEAYAGNYVGAYFAKTEAAEEKIRGLLEQIRSIPGRVHISFTADDNVVVRRPGQGGAIPVGSGGSSSPAPSGTSSSDPIRGATGGIPVAHTGMHVTAGLPRQPGDAPDERTIRTQVGETVLPRHMSASQFGGGSSSVVNNNQQVVLQGETDPKLEFRGRQWLKRMAA